MMPGRPWAGSVETVAGGGPGNGSPALAVNLRPIRLGDAPMTCLCPGGLVEGRFQHRIADILSQRPR